MTVVNSSGRLAIIDCYAPFDQSFRGQLHAGLLIMIVVVFRLCLTVPDVKVEVRCPTLVTKVNNSSLSFIRLSEHLPSFIIYHGQWICYQLVIWII